MNTDQLGIEAQRISSDQRAFEALVLGLSPQARLKVLRLVKLLVLAKGDEVTMRALRPVKGADAQIALLESRLRRRN